MMGWVIEGTLTHGPNKGELERAIVESDAELTEEQAFWFGAGQLRGMGYAVENVRVEPAPPNRVPVP